MIGSGGNVHADPGGGNNGSCSEFGQFMPPTTPGVNPAGAVISAETEGKDGIHFVNELKKILWT